LRIETARNASKPRGRAEARKAHAAQALHAQSPRQSLSSLGGPDGLIISRSLVRSRAPPLPVSSRVSRTSTPAARRRAGARRELRVAERRHDALVAEQLLGGANVTRDRIRVAGLFDVGEDVEASDWRRSRFLSAPRSPRRLRRTQSPPCRRRRGNDWRGSPCLRILRRVMSRHTGWDAWNARRRSASWLNVGGNDASVPAKTTVFAL
jgi:hypothetical protein